MTAPHDTDDASVEYMTVGSFVESLGAKRPTPGGGAAASVVLALGAAIGRMVVAYSQGKKSLAEHGPMLAEAFGNLESHARDALRLADQDAAAYETLAELWKLPVDDKRRVGQWDDAVRAAIDAPRAVMQACLAVLEQLQQLVGRSNRMLASDLAIAAILAESAIRAAAWNIRINLPQVDDAAIVAGFRDEMDTTLERAHALAASIEHSCVQES